MVLWLMALNAGDYSFKFFKNSLLFYSHRSINNDPLDPLGCKESEVTVYFILTW